MSLLPRAHRHPAEAVRALRALRARQAAEEPCGASRVSWESQSRHVLTHKTGRGNPRRASVYPVPSAPRSDVPSGPGEEGAGLSRQPGCSLLLPAAFLRADVPRAPAAHPHRHGGESQP